MFTAENADADCLAIPRFKKRKISKSEDLSDEPDDLLFVPLLTGLEHAKSVQARSDLFHTTWSPQQEMIDVRAMSCLQ